MFEILVTLLSVYLFFATIRTAFKITWGIAKITATILLVVAAPALILCLVFAGGAVILVPALLIAGAFALIKMCA